MPIGSRLVIKRKAHAPQVLFLSVGRSLDNLVSRCFITAVLTLVGVLDVVDSLDLGWNVQQLLSSAETADLFQLVAAVRAGKAIQSVMNLLA